MFADLTEFHDWFLERRRAHEYQVTPRPLDQLDGWSADGETGDITHRSGKFFAVRGIHVETNRRAIGSWSQPIILQPEIGLLGIMVTVVDGEVHCLMQAKMEPGNINLLQLSPTVQATRSNYTQVHGGSRVPYLDYFMRPRADRTVFDALQSEQGSWFLAKRNRNVIVQIESPITPGEEFCWLSLPQIADLLAEPNLVNMDARTVLSGMPFIGVATRNGRDGARGSRYSDEEVLSWFTEVKTNAHLDRRLLPLAQIPGWQLRDGIINRPDGKHFTVLGVHVRASSREVAEWSQPMIKPVNRGIIAFLGRFIDGVFHVLVCARTEAGTSDLVEMAPTVSCIPDSFHDEPPERRPRYLDLVQSAAPDRILVDAVHSEEGGRFYHAENRYLVIDVGEEFDLDAPPDYCWTTPEQLTGFVRYGNHVNVAARCLLSCMVGERGAFQSRDVVADPVL
ncbi:MULTISPECIES: NDP-hexose 2,3-dehydratase family protein [unclassified Amycolatopsis]|uniref:NDP-hexose 2,3-dehydratase family protein n=1 Tax=unclassified Amycolatopsis TaxID=2618356 RepID=UPI001C6A7D5D|nr:NDP-hexose 2,3-dehydratase family protein [Amycolatopsis sp. DSM 110486]QYN17789.1 NDP-hexose 2,3-dehydratase family protein [Amycolatopsis sp. DSM 110486]